MNNTALVVAQAKDQLAMPTLSMAQAKVRRDEMVSFVQGIMVDGLDYGKMPGTTKPTLLKPGAEKLATFFGLRPTFSEVRVVEDWTGKDSGGRPFFYYWFRCHLLKDDVVVAEGDGSCNSMESKYRYRQGERVCPNCGKATIIKGKAEYGGGWVCFAKKGGCGSRYDDNDPTITEQQVGRIENPDPADQVNTLLKMAQKRALVAAVLIAVNASEFFTQDVEDLAGDIVDGDYVIVQQDEQSGQRQQSQRAGNGNGAQSKPAASNGNNGEGANGKPKLARIIGNPGFPAYAVAFSSDFPRYKNQHGGFDAEHICAAAAKLKFEAITTNNIEAVFAALRQYATEQQALANAPA